MAKKDIKEKIEAALDIADKMKAFDSTGTTSTGSTSKDEELRRRAEERKDKVAQIRADLVVKKEFTDEKFIKDKLRDLAEMGVEALHILSEELQYDPSGRNAECMGALTNAVVGALKEIKEFDNDKTKLGYEREKIDIKKASSEAAGNGAKGNILVVGRMTDVLKAINDQKFNNMKEVDAVVEKEHLEDTAPGTVYEKKDL
jgi:hypothetical protein